jgi:hypothetical protein
VKKVYTEEEQRKIKAGRCIVPGCGKKAGKRSKGKKKMCHMHDRRQWAKSKPAHYKYANLRGNARRRSKEFSISRDYFMEVVKDSGYVEHAGRAPGDLSIDREKNWLGYVEGNLRVVTVHYNSVKGTRDADDIKCPF